MDKFMKEAYKESLKAFKKNEVPIGAVIVINNKIIARAHNSRQRKKSVINHAEILAVLKAAKKIGDWRLNDCVLYVTLKPCSMCEAIIKESRIKKVYFGIEKPTTKKEYNKTIYTQTNVCESYKEILNKFFKNKR